MTRTGSARRAWVGAAVWLAVARRRVPNVWHGAWPMRCCGSRRWCWCRWRGRCSQARARGLPNLAGRGPFFAAGALAVSVGWTRSGVARALALTWIGVTLMLALSAALEAGREVGKGDVR